MVLTGDSQSGLKVLDWEVERVQGESAREAERESMSRESPGRECVEESARTGEREGGRVGGSSESGTLRLLLIRKFLTPARVTHREEIQRGSSGKNAGSEDT